MNENVRKSISKEQVNFLNPNCATKNELIDDDVQGLTPERLHRLNENEVKKEDNMSASLFLRMQQLSDSKIYKNKKQRKTSYNSHGNNSKINRKMTITKSRKQKLEEKQV